MGGKPEHFDLVIIGAGFSGLNALAAAVEFASHLKIAVIEATDRVGGHWNTVYPYVRLHHKAYGIGKHGLVGNQNTRSDILSYANNFYNEIISRADLNVTFIWNTRHVKTSTEDLIVVIHTNKVTISAGRVIDTVRYGLPQTLCTEPLGVLPRDLPNLPKASSYVIIGSGKTAMDTLRFIGRPATVIGGTPVSFVNRHVPLKIVLARAFASLDSKRNDGDSVLESMHENGDMFFFMGQRGDWRLGFTDAQELAEAESYVKEYLPNTHVDRCERGDTLRVFLRGGGILEFDKDTVLVDCRGIQVFRSMKPTPAIHALEGERILYTFLTDIPDPCSAYSMTAMFIKGDLENLKQITPPVALMQHKTSMTTVLRYVLDMNKARRHAPMSDAARDMIDSNIGLIDMIKLWWIKDMIKRGIRIVLRG
jgi:hypothetical protein